jgi:hypothetical protein
MYLILPIAFVVVLPSWFVLRRLTHIWVEKPLSVFESIVSGIAAWLFLMGSGAWVAGIIMTTVSLLNGGSIQDILFLTFSALATIYVVSFIVRSNYELRLDDTRDFIKEALQFRRSAQHRLDVLSFIKQRQRKSGPNNKSINNTEAEREHLQKILSKEKEYENIIALIRDGDTADISGVWRESSAHHAPDSIYKKVYEARIEPGRKRLSIYADFPELSLEQLRDEMTILRFNREVYDFLQSLHVEPWLKHYMQFFDCYFLVCRAPKKGEDGGEFFFPFMKVGAAVSDLLKLEGAYFNPRKLGEVLTLAFNNGAQV